MAPMAILGSDANLTPTQADEIRALVEAYRATKRQLDDEPDAFERTVGYAALQRHAQSAARHLNTTAVGLGTADLEPLKSFAQDLTVGGSARGPIGLGIDAARSSFTASPAPLAIGGATVAGVVVNWLVNVGGIAGAALIAAPSLTALVVYFVVRTAYSELKLLWPRAKSVGNPFRLAFNASALPVEQRLWVSAGGGSYGGVQFVPVVRFVAMAGVVVLWAVLIACGVIFAISALAAFAEASTNT